MKRALSIFLACLLILGNLGVTFGKHYCMGIPVKEALMIGHEDLSCGMASMESTGHSDETSISKDCCDDEYLTMENGDLIKEVTKVHVPCIACGALAILYEVEISPSDESAGPIAFYYPPPPDVDITIVHQVFLI